MLICIPVYTKLAELKSQITNLGMKQDEERDVEITMLFSNRLPGLMFIELIYIVNFNKILMKEI